MSKFNQFYQSPYCIAEVGINHNGDVNTALEMISAAKDAGADAVKFQTFKADEICLDSEQQFEYISQGKAVKESMLAMFQRCELPDGSWVRLKDFADSIGIDFFSTPQNLSDIHKILPLNVPFIKDLSISIK